MAYAKKVDANHSIIVKTLRQLGCSVFDTSKVGRGFPDLVVGKNNKTVLVEVKADEKAKWTVGQKLFMLNWNGSAVARIDSIDSAIRLVKMLDNQ
jgi:Holliday junction resolvase